MEKVSPRDPLANAKYVPWEKPDYDLILRVQHKTVERIGAGGDHSILSTGNSPVAEDRSRQFPSPGAAAVENTVVQLSSAGQSGDSAHAPVPSTLMCNVLIEDALQQTLRMIRMFRQSDAGGCISQLAKDLAAEIVKEVSAA